VSCCDIHESQVDLHVSRSFLQRTFGLFLEYLSRLICPLWTGGLSDIKLEGILSPHLVWVRLFIVSSSFQGCGKWDSRNQAFIWEVVCFSAFGRHTAVIFRGIVVDSLEHSLNSSIHPPFVGFVTLGIRCEQIFQAVGNRVDFL